MTRSGELPQAVFTLLDGTGLDAKVGTTLQLAVSDDAGWPRVATISVGEVLAVSATRLLMTLYTRSRTAAMLEARGRGLMLLVDDGVIVKIEFAASRLAEHDGRTTFNGAVVGVERDEVPYARVTEGIRFELVAHEEQVLARWRTQLDELSELAS
jgi:hypothetical protein